MHISSFPLVSSQIQSQIFVALLFSLFLTHMQQIFQFLNLMTALTLDYSLSHPISY